MLAIQISTTTTEFVGTQNIPCPQAVSSPDWPPGDPSVTRVVWNSVSKECWCSEVLQRKSMCTLEVCFCAGTKNTIP